MPYRSNTAQIAALFMAGTDDGLVAGAQVYKNGVKRGLRGGYTTGDFVTGASINAVTSSPPEDGPGDSRQVRSGTNLLYNLAWEIGFTPARGVFSPGIGRGRQGPIAFQRKEVWVPALIENAEAMRTAFYRALNRRLGGSGRSMMAAALAPALEPAP